MGTNMYIVHAAAWAMSGHLFIFVEQKPIFYTLSIMILIFILSIFLYTVAICNTGLFYPGGFMIRSVGLLLFNYVTPLISYIANATIIDGADCLSINLERKAGCGDIQYQIQDKLSDNIMRFVALQYNYSKTLELLYIFRSIGDVIFVILHLTFPSSLKFKRVFVLFADFYQVKYIVGDNTPLFIIGCVLKIIHEISLCYVNELRHLNTLT